MAKIKITRRRQTGKFHEFAEEINAYRPHFLLSNDMPFFPCLYYIKNVRNQIKSYR